MDLRAYLPSTRFVVMASALALSIGLVWGAEYITRPPTPVEMAVETGKTQAQNQNWEAALYEIQAQQGVGSLPTPPDQKTVDGLLQAAKSNNLTDSVGRTLFVNLANAKAQGLGDDIPTQNQLLNEATKQLSLATKTSFSQDDLRVVPASTSTVHAYANALMTSLINNSRDNKVYKTLHALGYAADNQSDAELKNLSAVEKEYRSFVEELRAMPVPQTLAPLHLMLINDLAQTADAYPNIEALLSDPLRGLAGMKQYQTLSDQTGQMLINIAQVINKEGILFDKDEPGRAWSGFVSLH